MRTEWNNYLDGLTWGRITRNVTAEIIAAPLPGSIFGGIPAWLTVENAAFWLFLADCTKAGR
jgi:hypothetical protein